MNAFLVASHVTLKHHHKTILSDIGFKIKKGTCTVICGPSGSGKSSLLRCINLLNDYDEGVIELLGKDLHAYDRKTLRKIVGMVFQQYNLFGHLTVLANCTLALKYSLKLDDKAAKERALTYLNQVNMASHAHQYPNQLSGGQQQRVAIARALSLQPELLLLDEPTAALDPETSFEVLETIKALADQGVTMLYVTHEIHLARQIANHVIFLEDGKVFKQGKVEDVLVHPKEVRIQKFLKRVAKGLT